LHQIVRFAIEVAAARNALPYAIHWAGLSSPS
jgi:hypothetical protein